MYPPPVALPNQLGKLDAPLLMHLLYYFEQLAMIGSVPRNDIGGTAEEMVAILGASHQGVELFAAITAAHHDRLAPRFAYRVKDLLYQYVQQVVCTLTRAIVDALAQRRDAGGEFLYGKIFHRFSTDIIFY